MFLLYKESEPLEKYYYIRRNSDIRLEDYSS